MKKLFQKELAIFSTFKSIRLHDLNLGGALLALIIMVVNLLTDNINLIPTIGRLTNIGRITNTALVVMILTIFIIGLKNRVTKKDLQAFICIQTVLIFLNLLLESIFPTSADFMKVFISLYFVFNMFVFLLFSISEPIKLDEEKKEEGKKEKKKEEIPA